MTSHSALDAAAAENQILASLPKLEFRRLQPHLQWAETFLGEIIYDSQEPINEVYFPTSSLISLINHDSEADQVEFSLVGNEGLVGLPALLGGGSSLNRAIVQIADQALKIDAKVLKNEFMQGGMMQKQILLYIQLTLTETAQNVTCQVHHKVEQRFARWLLSVHDRLQKPELPLTQKYIAMLLGTRRATITEVAGKFQKLGMIRYRRGQLTICDRARLEQTACSCYGLLRNEQARLQAISRNLA